MTARREENVPVADERAPLLGNEDVRNHERVEESDGEDSIAPQKETSRTWEYIWKGLLTILAILAIAVFVKGWIDADDVDVSFLTAQDSPTSNSDDNLHHSLILKAH
jgi:hypothetical protein